MKLKPARYFALLSCAITAAFSPTQAKEVWEKVFNDEFSDTSFDSDGSLKWNTEGGQWNKIDYVNWNVADWRKYQSQDDALVTKGDGYVTLKGSYGDFTSQTSHPSPPKNIPGSMKKLSLQPMSSPLPN